MQTAADPDIKHLLWIIQYLQWKRILGISGSNFFACYRESAQGL